MSEKEGPKKRVLRYTLPEEDPLIAGKEGPTTRAQRKQLQNVLAQGENTSGKKEISKSPIDKPKVKETFEDLTEEEDISPVEKEEGDSSPEKNSKVSKAPKGEKTSIYADDFSSLLEAAPAAPAIGAGFEAPPRVTYTLVNCPLQQKDFAAIQQNSSFRAFIEGVGFDSKFKSWDSFLQFLCLRDKLAVDCCVEWFKHFRDFYQKKAAKVSNFNPTQDLRVPQKSLQPFPPRDKDDQLESTAVAKKVRDQDGAVMCRSPPDPVSSGNSTTVDKKQSSSEYQWTSVAKNVKRSVDAGKYVGRSDAGKNFSQNQTLSEKLNFSFSKTDGFVDQTGKRLDFSAKISETQSEQILRSFNKLTIEKNEIYLPSNQELNDLKNGGMTERDRALLRRYQIEDVKEDESAYEYHHLEQPWRPNPADKNKKVYYRLPMDRLILGKRLLENVPVQEPPSFKKGMAWLKKCGSCSEKMSFSMQQNCRFLLAEDMVQKRLILKLLLCLSQEITANSSENNDEIFHLIALARQVIEHVYGRHLRIFKIFGDIETKSLPQASKNILDKKLLDDLITRSWRFPIFKGDFTDKSAALNPVMMDFPDIPLSVKTWREKTKKARAQEISDLSLVSRAKKCNSCNKKGNKRKNNSNNGPKNAKKQKREKNQNQQNSRNGKKKKPKTEKCAKCGFRWKKVGKPCKKCEKGG